MTGKSERVSNIVPMAAAGAILLLAMNSGAGTVVVHRVVANEVRTGEIGTPPPLPEVMYYSFNTAPGTYVYNEISSDYKGTRFGCSWSADGRYSGGAMSFDGVNDYIKSGSLEMPEWEQYSASVWFRHNGGGTAGAYGQKILDKSYGSTKYWFLSVDTVDGSLGMKLNMTGHDPIEMVDASTNFMDNAWHHAVIVRDGVYGWLWVDGVVKANCANMYSVDNSTLFYIGYSSNSSHKNCWSGLLDEIRVFDYPLSLVEVTDLYEEGCLLFHDSAVNMGANLAVGGSLTVTGSVSFTGGIYYARPLGDLSCGVYTNTP
ncbi:MAG: LamG domain-containing protein [Kiritimatiellae bacterium]|nr:LamG domain-containing protein [Kiritimatiellia bacterium]